MNAPVNMAASERLPVNVEVFQNEEQLKSNGHYADKSDGNTGYAFHDGHIVEVMWSDNRWWIFHKLNANGFVPHVDSEISSQARNTYEVLNPAS